MAVAADRLPGRRSDRYLLGDNESSQRILECAIEVIETQGEAAVRVARVAAMAGIAVPSVYHWFGSREGLVIAAHSERFRRNLSVLINPYRQALAESTTAAEFRVAILRALELVFDPSRSQARLTRLNVLGSATTRPELLSMVALRHKNLVEDVSAVIADGQTRGWVRRDHDADSLGLYLVCEVFAQVIIEFGASSLPRSRWVHLSRQTLSHVLFGTPVQHLGPHPVEAVRQDHRPDVPSTAQRILDWAVERIDDSGEASLRITELLGLGISLTSIYHHFGSREHMVQAAQAERFTQSQGAQMAQLEEMAGRCSTADEFAGMIRATCSDLFDEARAPTRRRRLSALGSLHGRPALAADIAGRENELAARGAHILEQGRRNGWLAPEVDSLAVSAWMMGLGLSRVLLEVIDIDADGAAWNRIATEAVEAALGI